MGCKRHSPAQLARLWLSSFRDARNGAERLTTTRQFVIVVGYPRRGHGLVASLLDAHPDALVAHELDALHFADLPFSRGQILALVAANSREFSDRGRTWGGFGYSVPDSWQGRIREPLVLGDKKGARTARRLQGNPKLLSQLSRILAMDIRVIHCIRNPFDTLGARIRRAPHTDPDKLIDAQLGLYHAVAELDTAGTLGQSVLIRHEDFVGDPRTQLGRLCDALGLPPDDDHLDAAVRIVFTAPLRSRVHFPWTPARVACVEATIRAVPALSGYRHEEHAMTDTTITDTAATKTATPLDATRRAPPLTPQAESGGTARRA